MLISKNIIAALLALLLASPACMCALAGCGAACGSEPQKAEPSCCSSSSQEGDQDDKKSPEKHDCMCAQSSDYAEPGKMNLPSPELTMIPAPADTPVVARSIPPVFGGEFTSVVFHPPPGPPLRILYSVFRL